LVVGGLAVGGPHDTCNGVSLSPDGVLWDGACMVLWDVMDGRIGQWQTSLFDVG